MEEIDTNCGGSMQSYECVPFFGEVQTVAAIDSEWNAYNKQYLIPESKMNRFKQWLKQAKG